MTKGNQGRFLLLYGSQTGQAKAIAEEIYENAPNHGLQPEIHCLSVTDKKFSIEKETWMVIVVSTTGDGEPPDTAAKFWRRIKKKTLPSDHLANLSYALLGLGDSNYNNFCRNPKNFDKRFEELGAKRFYPSGFADDAVGLELVVEPWMDGLWPALRKHLGLNDGDNTDNGIPDAEQNIKKCAEDGIDGSHQEKSSEDKLSESHETTDGKNDVDGSQKQAYNEERTSSDKQGEDDNESESGTTNNENSRTNQSNTRTMPSTSVSQQSSNMQSSKEGTSTDIVKTATERRTSQTRQEPVKAEESRSGPTTDIVQEEGPPLTRSVPPLSESGLTLPLLPPPFLQVHFVQDKQMSHEVLSPQGNASYPSANSAVSMATITSATQLTRDDAVKTALDLELDISDTSLDYQPGDSFSIICPNPTAEVDILLKRLGLSEQSDNAFTLQLIANTKKRRAAVPDYIPQLCTVRHVLTHCCDIRTTLKKAFIRMLVEYTESASEKRRLQELCSKQGARDYGAYIRDSCVSILDILIAFPSCNPPLERLLEHLPRLLPRPYSISSSPLVDPRRLHFVFNVVEFPHANGRAMARQGVCTGWLNHNTQAIQCEADREEKLSDIEKDMAALSIDQKPKIPIFARTNTHFRLPDDLSTPIIMIGPGTGVAPFVGFLEHREIQIQKTVDSGDEPVDVGPSWLLFGCRHKERDYLYRDKLQHFVDSSVLTKLLVSFSRDAPSQSETEVQALPRYVQDNLRLHAADILDLLLEKNAVLYVCGDAKNMAKNVNETLLELIGKRIGKGAYESTLILAKLREEKRYREDIWT